MQLRALGRASPRLESAEPLAPWYVCPQRSQPHFHWSSLLFPVRDQPWTPPQAVGPTESFLLHSFPIPAPQFPDLVTLGSSQHPFQLTSQGLVIERLLPIFTWLRSPSPEWEYLSREGEGPGLTLFLWTHISRLSRPLDSRGRHGVINLRDSSKELEGTGVEAGDVCSPLLLVIRAASIVPDHQPCLPILSTLRSVGPPTLPFEKESSLSSTLCWPPWELAATSLQGRQ